MFEIYSVAQNSWTSAHFCFHFWNALTNSHNFLAHISDCLYQILCKT